MAKNREMTFNWNDEKNKLLKEKRNISFEEIVLLISENRVVSVISHPNTEKYPKQRMYLIELSRYIWVVPFVKDEKKEEIILKTAFPSRYYTKAYLGEEGQNGRK